MCGSSFRLVLLAVLVTLVVGLLVLLVFRLVLLILILALVGILVLLHKADSSCFSLLGRLSHADRLSDCTGIMRL